MVIRCERCSTLYELDESVLSPSGSQVQCSRCQHLFTAYPPGAPGRTLPGVPAQPGPRQAAPPVAHPTNGAAAAPAAAAPAAPALPRARSAPVPPRATPSPSGTGRPEQKPVRTAPAPVYRPAAPAAGAPPPQGVTRGPMLRRDTVGTFEARLRRSARMRWLAPSLAVGALALLVGGWLLLSRRGEGQSTRAREEALALAALDDAASLDRAIARLEEIERRSPAVRAVTAERAFVQVLRAGALADEGEAIAARLAARNADRERLRREQPAGWEEAERAAAAEVQGLEPEVRAREERARALSAAALEALRRVEAEAGDTPEVVRGLAAYHALTGSRERVHEAVRATRGATRDPWLDLATACLDAREQDRAARERAMSALRALVGAHPELLRGRLLLARTQAGLGRRAEAVATLDGLLGANGHHEAARRLREELSAPVVAPPAAVAAPPVVVKPATHRRKIASQPAPPENAPSPEVGDSAGVPPPPIAVPTPSVPAAPAAPATPQVDAGAGGNGADAEAPAPRPPPRPAPRHEPETPPPGNGG